MMKQPRFQNKYTRHDFEDSPIAVGGVGGSGTRVIAQILTELGVYMGDDLNTANDNLWFTLLFKHREIIFENDEEFQALVDIFLNSMIWRQKYTIRQTELIKKLAAKDRPQHPIEWLQDRKKSMLDVCPMSKSPKLWGWKEPNTHMVIDRLVSTIPNLKYIHVVRNGLDTAYSDNQNQLRFWGNVVFGESCEVTPRNSLKFWRWAHDRILRIGETMGSQFLFLRFDDLCSSPESEIRKIVEFLDLQIEEPLIKKAASLVVIPKTSGRYKTRSLNDFDPEDIAFVQRLGFGSG